MLIVNCQLLITIRFFAFVVVVYSDECACESERLAVGSEDGGVDVACGGGRRIATAIRTIPKMVATVAMKSCILTLGRFMLEVRGLTASLLDAMRSNF